MGVWLLLLLLLPSEGAPATGEFDELKALVNRALQINPLVKAADGSIDEFEAKYREVSLWWVPRGKASGLVSAIPAKYGNAVSGGTDMDTWGPILRMEVVGGIPLFTFGKISALRDMAAAGIDVGRAQKALARNEIRHLVTKAWLALRFARDAQKLVEDGMSYLNRGRDYLDKMEREDSDDYDQIDRLRLRVYETDIEAMKMESARTVSYSIYGLALATASSEEDVAVADRALPFPQEESLPSLEKLLALAERYKPELMIVTAAVSASESQVLLEKRNWFPDIALMGTFSFSKAPEVEGQSSPFAYDPYNSWFGGGGITMTMPLDLGRMTAVDVANAKLRQLREKKKALLMQSSLELKKLLLEANDARKMVDLAKKAAKAARGWVIAKTDMYESGLGSFKDLTEGLTQYYQRELQYRKAILDYNLAKSSLAAGCGLALWELSE